MIAIRIHMSFFQLLQFVEALEVCDAALMEFPEDFRYLLFTKVYLATPLNVINYHSERVTLSLLEASFMRRKRIPSVRQ